MSESLLYFLWQYQYFQTQTLRTTAGEPVTLRHPGFRNTDAGPDFTNARLLIGEIEWVGTVEMHVYTSDWMAHRHQHDRAYDNVILHVVWHDDKPQTQIARSNGTPIPTLALQPLTDTALLARYAQLADAKEPIACAGQFKTVPPIRIAAMLDKALLNRLERKAALVHDTYRQAGHDWEETAYRLLAANLGFRVNAEPMSRLSRALPIKIIAKHRNNPTQLEALLFGLAGLLPVEVSDDYTDTLRREYHFLAAKYDLAQHQLDSHTWKWGRLRPANFPTLRIAQLAQLLARHSSLFSVLVNNTAEGLLRALHVQPSAYWHMHYRFGKAAAGTVPALGDDSAENLIINTVAPLLAAYAQHKDKSAYMDRAIELLESLPPENNRLTRQWDSLGLEVRSAFESQAGIELFNEFCTPKKCLSCQIGAALLKGQPDV